MTMETLQSKLRSRKRPTSSAKRRASFNALAKKFEPVSDSEMEKFEPVTDDEQEIGEKRPSGEATRLRMLEEFSEVTEEEEMYMSAGDEDWEESELSKKKRADDTLEVVYRQHGKAAEEENISSYEAQRRKNLSMNQELMAQLGLNKDQQKFVNNTAQNGSARGERKKRRASAWSQIAPTVPVSVKRSRRLAGEKPDMDDGAQLVIEMDSRDAPRAVKTAAREKRSLADIDNIDVSTIELPLLTDIGTTVTAIGDLYSGKNEKEYWSTRQCMYHHPYPVGYRATKDHFGKTWDMEINEGRDGPHFILRERDSGKEYHGNYPTWPWTQACLKSRSPGTRISGPLFFGFSDPLVIRLIRKKLEERQEKEGKQ